MERDLGVGGKPGPVVTCGSGAQPVSQGTRAQEAPQGKPVFGLGGGEAGTWHVGGVEWGVHPGQPVRACLEQLAT